MGQGRCRLHGGASLRLHGRYSTIQRPRIRALLEQHAADANPLDTLPEIALTRSLLVDYIERYDAYTEALIAWHASWRLRNGVSPEHQEALRRIVDEFEAATDELTERQEEDVTLARGALDALVANDPDKPHQVLDVADAYRMAGEVTKMVERVEKTRAANALTLEQMKRFLFALERVLTARIQDAALLARIRDDILSIQVG